MSQELTEKVARAIAPDEAALLAEGSSWASTYWFSGRTGYGAQRTYLLLRGLLKSGYMEGMQGRDGRVRWYRNTEAGRAMLSAGPLGEQ